MLRVFKESLNNCHFEYSEKSILLIAKDPPHYVRNDKRAPLKIQISPQYFVALKNVSLHIIHMLRNYFVLMLRFV